MNDYYINGLRLPPDLYSMIDNECKRQNALTGFWPRVDTVIIDALYAHFNAVEASYSREDSKK